MGVLKGDGIGTEIVDATLAIVQQITKKITKNTTFAFQQLPMGWQAIKEHNDSLPKVTLQTLDQMEAWIMGPDDASNYPDSQRINKRGPNSEMRHHFNLYANLRLGKVLPGVDSMAKKGDLLIVRENSEGFPPDRNLYKGLAEMMITPDVAVTTGVFTRPAIERIAHVAFGQAQVRHNKVTIVHKANVIKYAFGLFKDVCYEIGEKYYPEVEVNDIHVDACAAELITHTEKFDVLITENFCGDVLSDLTAALFGGLGVASSINTNGKQVMAQAGHGSAPDISGKNLANPTSMILSVVMMLRWLGKKHQDEELYQIADIMETATLETIAAGVKTQDLGGKATTTEFTEAVLKHIN